MGFGKKKKEENPPAEPKKEEFTFADKKKDLDILTPPPEMKKPAPDQSIGRIVLPFQKLSPSTPPEVKPAIPPPEEKPYIPPPEPKISIPLPEEKITIPPPEEKPSFPLPEEKPTISPPVEKSSFPLLEEKPTISPPVEKSSFPLPEEKPTISPPVEKSSFPLPEEKPTIIPPVKKPLFPLPEEKERKLVNNYFLLVIPSWHQATGAPFGKYINTNVAKLHSDPVIFFSTKEVAIETPMGTMYYLFGLGYYYLQFELADGKLITDNRPLTGLILSDFFYDKLASSKRIALEDEADVNVCELVIKVPVDLSHKTDQKRTFIRGVLTRFLFTAFKDPILEMMNKVFDPDTFLIAQWGHLLLSTMPEYFNQILVSNKMGAGALKTYMNNTAGINAFLPAADDLLSFTFSSANLLDIDESIQLLKTALTGVKFDPIDLYTLLDYLAMTLRAASILPPTPTEMPPAGSGKKRAVLISATNRLGTIAEWPAHLVSAPTDVLTAPTPTAAATPEFKELVHQFYKKMDDASYGDASQTTAVKVEAAGRENFQLRKMQRSATDKKVLPECPQGNVEEIFLYLKYVVDENFDMPSVGKAFEVARESIRKISLQSKYLRLMSRWANQYSLKQAGLSLSPKEKEVVMHDIDGWITDLEEEKRARLERERLERERLAREEQERIDKDRKVREHLAQLESDRFNKERADKERFEREHQARLEEERLQKELEEKQRLARDHEEQVRTEKQRLVEEKENLKRVVKERKQKEKEEKVRQNELKRIEKEKQKVEKQRQKEEQRLRKLKGE